MALPAQSKLKQMSITYTCGTCGSTDLVIRGTDDRWFLECGRGHVIRPTTLAITVTPTEIREIEPPKVEDTSPTFRNNPT